MCSMKCSIWFCVAGPGEDEQERPQLRHLHGGHGAGGEDQDQEGVLPAAGEVLWLAGLPACLAAAWWVVFK